MTQEGEAPPVPVSEGEAAALLGLLWRANHELELLSKRMIRALGVTGPQRMVLRIVGRRPGISAGGICEAARIHPSTLTGILDRLARADLLLRARDQGDARRAVLALTPKGQRVADQRRGTVEAAVVASLGPLTVEERLVVRRWLAAFSDALAVERGSLGSEEPGEGHGAADAPTGALPPGRDG